MSTVFVKMLIMYMFGAILIGIFAAIYIFPALSVILALTSVIRRKKAGWKTFRLPVFLLLSSLVCWNMCSLLTNGAGYQFHHDFGSKVYNEGYIIPHYEKMYGDSLKLVDKEVIDSCNARYTLQSGITGQIFTVDTNYYDEGSGAFDRLHLSANYEDVLAKRLLSGERICLPLEEGSGARLGGRMYHWYLTAWADDSCTIHIYSTGKTVKQKLDRTAAGDIYYISLEDENLVYEVPARDGTLLRYAFVCAEDDVDCRKSSGTGSYCLAFDSAVFIYSESDF